MSTMCHVLGVSTSGFYAWPADRASRRALDDDVLGVRIAAIHSRARAATTARRACTRELAIDGTRVGCKRVARLMRAQGLQGAGVRRSFRTTQAVDAGPRPRRPRRPELRGRRARPPVGGGYHLCAYGQRVAVSRCRARRVLATRRRVVDAPAHEGRVRCRGARDGARRPTARPRSGPPFGPRHAVHLVRLRDAPATPASHRRWDPSAARTTTH